MKRIGLISDTHGYLDERILLHLRGCDEIWHAGDIGSLKVTETLESICKVRAVYGNIDGTEVRAVHPEYQIFIIEQLMVMMVHIGGSPGRYIPEVLKALKLHRPGIFVCGHSHICLVKRDQSLGHIHMNPGAAGRHGFHKVRTLLTFTVTNTQITQLQVVELGLRSKME